MKPITPFFTTLRHSALSLGLFIGLWAFVSLFFPVYVLPSPVTVFSQAPRYLEQGMLAHLLVTLIRVAGGFSLAFLIGTTIGVLAAAWRRQSQLSAFLVLFQVIPGTILGIIFLLLFGIGHRVPIALVAVLILPLVAINTANSLGSRNVKMEQYLTSIGGRRIDVYRHVYLPRLIPTFQSNLAIGFGLSLKVVILGEFIGAQSGVGFLLNLSRIYFRMDEVFFHLFVIVCLMAGFQVVQSFLFSILGKKYFFPD